MLRLELQAVPTVPHSRPGRGSLRQIPRSQGPCRPCRHLPGVKAGAVGLVALVARATCVARAARKEYKESWRRRKNSQLYRELEEGMESAQPRRRKPEVLAPAGGWPQLRAAVRAGADAVYFGLDVGLNARARAANFTTEELPEVMKFLHSHGVKAYVTLNTLVFDHELFDSSDMRAGSGSAIDALRVVSEAKVDALIVQDIGLALVCRELCPQISVHASTQMSITSAPGALFAERLGADRVVLGRELSIKEIASVAADVGDLEVEVFVHGALCVSYSGQCFSSEAWGGRSANRGQCAQACRLPYGLVKDGELIDLGDAVRYLLSPQDLMALDYVPALIDAGVGCFKIEGRLKGEEYVALTTAAYRQAIDQAWDATATAWEETPAAQLLAEPQTARTALAQLFARGQDEEHDGLSPGFLEGPQHQRLVRGIAPKHRGVLVGTVCAVQSATASFALKLAPGAVNVPLRPGAGIFFDQNVGLGEDADVLGGKVAKLRKSGAGGVLASSAELHSGDMLLVRLDFGGQQKERSRRMEEVKVGDLVWRNKDEMLEEQVKELSLVNQSIFEHLPEEAESFEIFEELQPGHPATMARLQRLVGSAPNTLGQVLPATLPRLTVLCRTAQQAEAVLRLPPGMVYELQLDFLEAQGLHESVQRARAAQQRVAVCLPRILKPNEDRLWQFYQRLEADAMLVRSCGALNQLLSSESKTDAELIGDFSLNAANAVTAAFFLGVGLDRLTPSHDLSAQQICQLAKRLGPERAAKLEVVAHQHLPIFHTEHCVFCRFLSNGNDYTDCGHPCERHNLHLRDSNGKDHKVVADMGCRNTVFNAKAQSAAMDLAAFASAQVGFFRLELVDEVPEAVETLVRRYHSAASGRLPAEKLWSYVASLSDSNGRRQGVERGSLDDSTWREQDFREMKVTAASRASR